MRLALALLVTALMQPPTLRPCPATPNCVSTEATDARQAMAPVPFTDAPDRAQARARAALLAEPRTTVVEERAGYLHAESRSRVFRFRSASRVGRRDFGVNRARMQRVSGRLAER